MIETQDRQRERKWRSWRSWGGGREVRLCQGLWLSNIFGILRGPPTPPTSLPDGLRGWNTAPPAAAPMPMPAVPEPDRIAHRLLGLLNVLPSEVRKGPTWQFMVSEVVLVVFEWFEAHSTRQLPAGHRDGLQSLPDWLQSYCSNGTQSCPLANAARKELCYGST
jgi:hypothetical protein